MPLFVHLPSGLRINLDTLVLVGPGIADGVLETTLADGIHELTGPDAPALLAAVDSQAWQPPGGPGPVGAEALRLLRCLVAFIDNAEGSHPDDVREARRLLARTEGTIPPGGSRPLQRELVAMLERVVGWLDDIDDSPGAERIVRDARALLARVEGTAAPASEVRKGDGS